MALTGWFRRLLRDSSGVAAVEFGLIGTAFLLLICILLDTGLMLFAQGVLDNATRTAIRPIQTGSSAVTQTTFDNALCAAVAPLIPCSQISFYVNSATTFSGLTPQTPNSTGQLVCTNSSAQAGNCASFTVGSATNFVLVQVAFSRQYLIPWLAKISSSTGTPALVSTVAFQIEPYYTP